MQANLREQLAVATRCIQWSYSIFWVTRKISAELEWGEGYYNGDIKTWKTMEALEMSSDQMGHQRSQQLRELYMSLSETTRPSSVLSPQDLSETEWYYLVCMSFVYNLGQGLPGRCLAEEKPIWICSADQADSRVFCRSLLAKSASIQTVVCFPFLGGVVELGVTDMVQEDIQLIQCVQASLLGNHDSITSSRVDTSITSETENGSEFCSTQHLIEDGYDLHYHTILSSLFKSTHLLTLKTPINFSKQSSFRSWKNGGTITIGVHPKARNQTPQKMLKKILFETPLQENVAVSLMNKNVSIDIRCRWKERLLLDILHSMTNLELDPHSFQASTVHGVLHLLVQSKMKESMGSSAGIIRQVLQKAITNCG